MAEEPIEIEAKLAQEEKLIKRLSDNQWLAQMLLDLQELAQKEQNPEVSRIVELFLAENNLAATASPTSYKATQLRLPEEDGQGQEEGGENQPEELSSLNKAENHKLNLLMAETEGVEEYSRWIKDLVSLMQLRKGDNANLPLDGQNISPGEGGKRPNSNGVVEQIQSLSRELEELKEKYNPPVLSELLSDTELLKVMNSVAYQALREALAQNKFQRHEDTPWPTAILDKGKAAGKAQLRPPALDAQPLIPSDQVEAWVNLMWKQQQELNDLDADALDLLSHTWLNQAQNSKDYALADVDQFLAMRGVQPKKGGQGRRGGYEPEQRAEMLRALSHVQNLWLDMGEFEVYEAAGKGRKRKAVTKKIQSRAFVVTDRMGQVRLDGYLDVEKFIFQPGHLFAQFLFGPGRQTAMLSAKAVQYDPYRQKWEKRLARYFSWQWRIRARLSEYKQPYRVVTLLEAAGQNINEQRPNVARERLEKALQKLQDDGVIATWQYDRWDERVAEQRGWAQVWLQATIVVEPPNAIREGYKTIEEQLNKNRKKPAKVLALPPADANSSLGDRIERQRKIRNLSQKEVAEQLKIAQSYFSKLESDKLKPAPELLKRIEEWLASEPEK